MDLTMMKAKYKKDGGKRLFQAPIKHIRSKSNKIRIRFQRERRK